MPDTARRDNLGRLGREFRPPLLLRELAGPREIGRVPIAYENTLGSIFQMPSQKLCRSFSLNAVGCKKTLWLVVSTHTYLAVDEAGPRPRKWTPTAELSQEAGLVLVGVATAGGSDTYWKGSGVLACMTGRPTLESTYAGEGSLLRQHETIPPNVRNSCHTTLAISPFGLSRTRYPPLGWTLAVNVDCRNRHHC